MSSLSWYTWHIFLSPLKLLGSLLCPGYGMIVQYRGNESPFPYSGLFHPTWFSFVPDWDRVSSCIHFISSSLLVNSPIMFFFTYFPSKLISHYMHVKQKHSLFLLILFVFLWTVLFLLWISCETKRFISSNFKYVEVRPNLVSFNPGEFSD